MKLRKLFALLMTAVMLLGMVPAGHAEVVACDHNWSYRWPNGQPANCQDWKWSEEYCTKCGVGNGGFEQCGPCSPVWTWVEGEPANCQETRPMVYLCQYCGEPHDEQYVAGPHSWGDWHGTEGTCLEPGREERSCHYCGTTEYRTGSTGAHDWGAWEKTKTGTCVEAGEETRACGLCGKKETRTTTMGAHQWGNWATTKPGTCVQEGAEQRSCSVCGKTEARSTGGGGHKYGDYTTVKEPTCVEKGRKEHYCEYCGAMEWGSIPMIDHSFGEWYVVTESQVGLAGLEQRDCVYGCGTNEQREIPPLSEGDNIPPAVELPTVVLEKHVMNTPANGEFFVPGEAIQFGLTLWVYGPGRNKASSEFIVNEATIFDPLKEEPVVVVDMGGTWNLGNSFLYTVTEEDALRGYVENTGYATWVYVENGQPGRVDSNTVTTPCGAGPLSADGLSLTLALSSTPANGTHFVVGEEVAFTETWSNGTGKTLYPFSVSIWTCGTPVFGSEIDQICSWFAEDAGGPVAPGASGFHTLTVTVTEADVARGEIYAMAELLSTVQDGPDLENVTTPFVTAPCGPDNSGDFGLVNGLTVTKQVTSTPANGSYYEPGEDITFVITVSNQGVEPLLNVNVIDPLGGGLVTVLETLNAGETRDITVVFTTTDIVAWAGSVDNGACVKAVDKDGRQYVEYSNIVTVPCGHTFLDVTITPPFGIFHSLAVIKKEESLPLNGEYYTEGEVIHYTITYTNDGELPLTDVEIWDILDVSTPIAHAETLQPGESRVCYYQHTVTAEDVDAGSVINIAHASYPVSNAAGFVNSCSNMVVSKTNAYNWMWGTPLFPMAPTPGTTTPDSTTPTPGSYTPGTGWTDLTPVTPGGSPTGGAVPPFGTIDTDKLRSGNSYCERTITGRDNASVSYDTSFCAEHADTQASALLMQQAAMTPELQAQAASYAVALWQTEVKSLYQKVYEAADPLAKAVVMTEYTRFLTEAANYEVLLKLLHPEQPALAAQMIAAMWEDKCVTLCNEAHAEASERKDSMLNVTPSAGATSTTCNCTVTAAASGKTSNKQSYCPVHGFPFSMIDMLLQGQNTAEAWAMVRQIWGVELTNAYNQISAKLGDNRILAMAEYNALTQWMMAREASLMALYPDNPEVVAQTMVKLIMDRVNDLCPTGK